MDLKEVVLKNICYTDLVYQRINKKLGISLSKTDIESLIYRTILDNYVTISKIGKNFYIKNPNNHIQVSVNSNTYRVITVDKIKGINYD